MTATQQPRFRRPDGAVDLDALEAHAGPELFDAIMRGLAGLADAQERAEHAMAQRSRGPLTQRHERHTRQQERTQAS